MAEASAVAADGDSRVGCGATGPRPCRRSGLECGRTVARLVLSRPAGQSARQPLPQTPEDCPLAWPPSAVGRWQARWPSRSLPVFIPTVRRPASRPGRPQCSPTPTRRNPHLRPRFRRRAPLRQHTRRCQHRLSQRWHHRGIDRQPRPCSAAQGEVARLGLPLQGERCRAAHHWTRTGCVGDGERASNARRATPSK